MPKNYQISQYDLPFSSEGWLEIETPAGPKKIGIIRAHLEEDAGKMLHDEALSPSPSHRATEHVAIRSSISTAPARRCWKSSASPISTRPEEAKAYLEELRLLLREIGVSDCEMQEGSLRCDANVNIHLPQADGSFIATPLVEVKNLNSFRGVERCIEIRIRTAGHRVGSQARAGHLANRSRAMLCRFAITRRCRFSNRRRTATRLAVSKATAGWDDTTGRTEIQRRKEEASDYRYFPEPDLVPVTVVAATIEQVRAELGELPAAQKARLQSQYGLAAYDAASSHGKAGSSSHYFEAVAKQCGDAKEACNWTMNDLLSTLNERNLDINASPLSGEASRNSSAKSKRPA